MDYLKQFAIEGLEDYSEEAVKEGFKRAARKACQKYFRTSRCEVDMYNKAVTIDFVMPRDAAALNDLKKKINIEYYEYEKLVPVVIPLDKICEIEKRVVRMTRELIRGMIIDSHDMITYNIWKKKVNVLVEGLVVYDTGNDFIEVEVNGTICRMYARNWIKSERSFLYKKGKKFWLHVISVTIGNGRPDCNISLSRRSINLPELLLSRSLPRYSFKCNKRWPGDMCWVSTDAFLGDKSVKDARESVSRELSGEKIFMKNEFKPGKVGRGHQKHE